MTATPTSSTATETATAALPGASRFGRNVRRAGQLFGIDLASLFSDEGEGEDGVASGFEGFVPEFAIRQQRIGRSPSTLTYKAAPQQPGEAVFKLTEELPSAVTSVSAEATASPTQTVSQSTTPAQDYSAIFGGLTDQIANLSSQIAQMGQTPQDDQSAYIDQTPDQGDQGPSMDEAPRPTYPSFVGGNPQVGALTSVNQALGAGLTPREITSQARQADIQLTPKAQTQVFRNVDVQQFNQQGPAMGAAAVNRALESGLRPGEVKKAAEAQGIKLTQKALQQIKKARK